MGFLDFLKGKKGPGITESAAAVREEPQALLLDVREPKEYAAGHIPGSKNLPLGRIREIERMNVPEGTKVYVYCLSGGRSGRAAAALRAMGYEVQNIGGIKDYRGPVEK